MAPVPDHRFSVKAVIVRDEQLLVIRKRDAEGDWFVLPGGGQRPGETMTDALRRECLEELGCDVAIGRMVWVRDYIDAHHPFPHAPKDLHQVELMFACTLSLGAEPRGGTEPDSDQLGVAWLSVDELPQLRLFPIPLRDLIPAGVPAGQLATYLGDVY